MRPSESRSLRSHNIFDIEDFQSIIDTDKYTLIIIQFHSALARDELSDVSFRYKPRRTPVSPFAAGEKERESDNIQNVPVREGKNSSPVLWRRTLFREKQRKRKTEEGSFKRKQEVRKPEEEMRRVRCGRLLCRSAPPFPGASVTSSSLSRSLSVSRELDETQLRSSGRVGQTVTE